MSFAVWGARRESHAIKMWSSALPAAALYKKQQQASGRKTALAGMNGWGVI